MIFEQSSVEDGKQLEYKVLGPELKELKNEANEGVEFEFLSGSNNATEALNTLMKDRDSRDLSISPDSTPIDTKDLSC